MTDRLRILQVCPKYSPSIGGLEEHVRNISERLAQKYEIAVAATDPSGNLPEESIITGVRVMRFKSWAPYESYYFSRQLKKYLAGNSDKYDIVHAHSYHAFPAFYAVQTKASNKIVFTPHFHGSGHSWFRNLLHKPYKYFGKRIFAKSDRIVSVSKYENALIQEHFNVPEEKIIIIPNGIVHQEFRCVNRNKKSHKTILTVGRIEEYKGMQYLIRVLPALDEDVILEIVGRGPYKEHLVDLAKKQRISDRVRFYQDLPREQLLQKYADADLFVLLSKFEAYSITVAEALASRLPCIVARTSALQEWIDDKNCFGIDYPIDLGQLANLVKKTIGKQVGNVNVPSWDDVAEKTAKVYEECLS